MFYGNNHSLIQLSSVQGHILDVSRIAYFTKVKQLQKSKYDVYLLMKNLFISCNKRTNNNIQC